MRNFIYNLVKLYVKTGLRTYYKKIEIVGLENVPKNKPVLFLPNHQSALMDVLLIAVDCNRKPYFLTRSDVFGKPLLNYIFNYFRMIPVYRMRDGRNTLSKNDLIFNNCANILNAGESIVMFPEANHNLKRRVRPLSKGFTRILFRAMERNPDLDIQIVPVGLNYQDATSFPDSVAIHYGKAVPLKPMYKKNELLKTEKEVKKKVADSLKQLTTHISSEKHYDAIIAYLNKRKVNFLRPQEVNRLVGNVRLDILPKSANVPIKEKKSLLYPFFVLLNLPVWAFWRFYMKPRVWELEFTGTLRFATALLGFTLYCAILLVGFSFWVNFKFALLVIMLIFLFDWIYIKYLASS
ncbi:lysophospholipid acyltransferase family protein [Maribacter thermophilus]|uniref:lysophospholipid acyltransferase family protein n=1 Tax=Maribacter thermophilus TaxID=1197874 RepID=UPI000AD42E0C|nr:lysophospholipid acyltransferase family protein [Maribacter thermophilus]